ncbi:hypothetical protein FRB94_000218 [Tulasnella sp. JGI-2019a]|nr:hypothetical protein FRB94_000218 [Tulasnella sp. JGI-2019a]KAG9015324.1 hypothetical protein FRB93_013024 [Tulasnella sp. JGI-2019a]KAG9039371.1 hypothetical protein FRB95_010659 [Tulasnella sp. JGI-2019a]
MVSESVAIASDVSESWLLRPAMNSQHPCQAYPLRALCQREERAVMSTDIERTPPLFTPFPPIHRNVEDLVDSVEAISISATDMPGYSSNDNAILDPREMAPLSQRISRPL